MEKKGASPMVATEMAQLSPDKPKKSAALRDIPAPLQTHAVTVWLRSISQTGQEFRKPELGLAPVAYLAETNLFDVFKQCR